ncbi:MAG TPA: polyamine ABC transporter ATP-binding protein, partial [Solirubrobacterales bacterium]|nr:polyamine ABC transporter ATP-binding protein [Solirubrobacterales bacterium]
LAVPLVVVIVGAGLRSFDTRLEDAAASLGAGLRVAGAVKRYGDVVALDGVSIDVRPGEFLTLLGPSGSGKTTMLNAIAGFTELSEGEIHLDEAPIAPIPTHKRNIGVIFQNYALFPHMTAAANVAYPLKQRGVGRAERERRVADALELVGLGDIGHRRPRELSGGQQQRVAFARAIVFNPRLLLMDEPLGALDRKLRESLQREIKSIHRDLGITFVYVTHDQSEALALSDRIAVFQRGRIEQIGTPEDLYRRPANRFVAEFMGESNILAGVLVATDEGERFRAEGLERLLVPPAERAPGRCCYVVRPQAIQLTGAGAGGPLDNELRGRVTDVSYLGASRRITLACGGRALFVRQDAGATTAPRVGDEVGLGWRSEDALLVPDGGPVEPVSSDENREGIGATVQQSY